MSIDFHLLVLCGFGTTKGLAAPVLQIGHMLKGYMTKGYMLKGYRFIRLHAKRLYFSKATC